MWPTNSWHSISANSRLVGRSCLCRHSGNVPRKSVVKACFVMAALMSGMLQGFQPAPVLAQSEFAQTKGGIPAGLTINVSGITVENAVALIAEHFGYRAEIHLPLPDTVDLNLQQANLDQAMNSALGELPVDYMIENNRLHVFRPRETWSRFTDLSSGVAGRPGAHGASIPPEPAVSRIIPLTKRRAEDVQKLLKELNPKISVVFDAPTNSLILLGEEKQIAEAETLSLNLDDLPVTVSQTATAPLILRQEYITRIFELEHADMEEIEKEIGTIIQRQESGTGGGQTGSSLTALRDKDGKPIETEYFVLDKVRRIVLIHTTEEKFRVIQKYFAAIDKPLAQVLIETHIVAVDSDFERNLGMKWSIDAGYLGPETPWSTSGAPDPGTGAGGANSSTGGDGKGPQAFQFGKWDLRALQGFLSAAQSSNKIQVLSRPRIMALTGQPASIHIGSELPYTTSTSVTEGGRVTENVDFKEIGIKLNVTPTVHTRNNTIRLHLVPEVSDKIGEASNGAPVVSTRKSETTVELKDGETMVIGGLIGSDESIMRSGVPILRDIPILGKAFQHSRKTRRKTNLMILLTARLVNENFAPVVKPGAVHELAGLHGDPNAMASVSADLACLAGVIIQPPPVDENTAVAVVASATVKQEVSDGNTRRSPALKDAQYYRKRVESLREKWLANEPQIFREPLSR